MILYSREPNASLLFLFAIAKLAIPLFQLDQALHVVAGAGRHHLDGLSKVLRGQDLRLVCRHLFLNSFQGSSDTDILQIRARVVRGSLGYLCYRHLVVLLVFQEYAQNFCTIVLVRQIHYKQQTVNTKYVCHCALHCLPRIRRGMRRRTASSRSKGRLVAAMTMMPWLWLERPSHSTMNWLMISLCDLAAWSDPRWFSRLSTSSIKMTQGDSFLASEKIA